ncbi:cysteine desulfurase NifS [soil metagenome]
MIYLDANATTPIDPQVLEAMLPFLTGHYANPSASYSGARVAKNALATAREQVSALIDAEPDEIIFTSGGTESNNAAIGSALTLSHPRKTHFITVKTEHPAVLEPATRWSEEQRYVSFFDVDHEGLLDAEELKSCVKEGQTALVSVMWANNETGVLSPVEKVAQYAHEHGAMFHTDAVQAIGKVPVSVKKLPVDYLSLSGHKFHAPKGIGALFISRRVRFKPWILGGGQEFGKRSGTENMASIVAMGKAAEIMNQQLAHQGSVQAMRDAFEAKVMTALPETRVNGSVTHRLPNTSSLCFPGIDAAAMLILLDEKGVACAAGSACHTNAVHPSPVLEAMGYDAAHAGSTLRFSWSHLNTLKETDTAAELVIHCARKIRSLQPDGLVKVH